jgi:hypothetical protein
MSGNLSVLPLEVLVKEFERAAIEQSQAILFDDTPRGGRGGRQRLSRPSSLVSVVWGRGHSELAL